jgi:hypothetical protein
MASSSAFADGMWCDHGSRLQQVNGAAFVLWSDDAGIVLIDAGSIGTDMPGRVFWNPQSDKTVGVFEDEDGQSIKIEQDGTTTTYTRCK